MGLQRTGLGLTDEKKKKKKNTQKGELVLSCLGCEGSWRADL